MTMSQSHKVLWELAPLAMGEPLRYQELFSFPLSSVPPSVSTCNEADVCWHIGVCGSIRGTHQELEVFCSYHNVDPFSSYWQLDEVGRAHVRTYA